MRGGRSELQIYVSQDLNQDLNRRRVRFNPKHTIVYIYIDILYAYGPFSFSFTPGFDSNSFWVELRFLTPISAVLRSAPRSELGSGAKALEAAACAARGKQKSTF